MNQPTPSPQENKRNNYGQYAHQNPNPYQEVPPMDFMEAVKASLNKYADFDGRSRRSEFWYFRLFQLIIIFPLALLFLLSSVIHEYLGILGMMLFVLIQIALIIPSLSSAVRRLHDTGNSGWLCLLDVFCTGGIIMIIFGCMDSQMGRNQYGPNPKGQGNDWR